MAHRLRHALKPVSSHDFESIELTQEFNEKNIKSTMKLKRSALS